MKTLIRNKQHDSNRSYDIQVIEFKGRKIKLVYETYNAVERYTTSILINDEWKHFCSLLDLGEAEQSSAYNILNEKQREQRVDGLFKKASKFIQTILK
ncbi:MAG TPA: hypothetical protein VMX17_17385 [Candidatus Glassbacteria bacterium]|nr:hypothetical protein [Candidatus Glassbacteria bacterium]